jgi:hypothetical protein
VVLILPKFPLIIQIWSPGLWFRIGEIADLKYLAFFDLSMSARCNEHKMHLHFSSHFQNLVRASLFFSNLTGHYFLFLLKSKTKA